MLPLLLLLLLLAVACPALHFRCVHVAASRMQTWSYRHNKHA
jgi:hypothetical protein